jgi:hypothetical protein
VAKKNQSLVPGARFAPFAPRNSHCQLRHDIHFGAMYEFSVPQPMAVFAYGLPRCGAEAQGKAATRIANMALPLELIEVTPAESRHPLMPGREKKRNTVKRVQLFALPGRLYIAFSGADRFDGGH